MRFREEKEVDSGSMYSACTDVLSGVAAGGGKYSVGVAGGVVMSQGPQAQEWLFS